MLVVVLFTGLVLSFAASFHLDIAQASQDAIESSREVRRAAAVLDRVTRDLESAVLVQTPEGVDPLGFPWLFFAEASGRGEGADLLRFQARNHRPRAAVGHESDRLEIAYWLAPAEDGESQELLRWTSAAPPQPPLARRPPRRDDPGVELLASRVASFGVKFQGKDGALVDAWDSWSPAHASELPIAAEVSVALLPEEPIEDELGTEPPIAYLRPVLFALRPLDLEKTLGVDGEDAEEEEDLACVTVNECVARNQAAFDQFLSADPTLQGTLESMGEQCWKDHAASLPVPVTDCE